MRDLFAKLQEPAYVLLRFVAGAMFMFHGLGKVFGIFGDKMTWAANKQIYIGGWLELVLGATIALGLFTRLSAFLAAGTMAVAYWQFHVKGDFADWHWLPVNNKGELSALYTFVFLYICGKGPGALSVDRTTGRDL
jgi:putative oxidoreductase